MAPISQTLALLSFAAMASVTQEFVTVDMRGLKAALVARAEADRLSVSAIVRRAVERELAPADVSAAAVSAQPSATPRDAMVKLSIRSTAEEAGLLRAAARRADVSLGAFLAGLLANVPALSAASAGRPEYLAALTASSAELSTLNRNIHHLTVLLGQGQGRAAQEYRGMLDTLANDVRSHLSLAASVLAGLRPSRLPSRKNEPSTRTTA